MQVTHAARNDMFRNFRKVFWTAFVESHDKSDPLMQTWRHKLPPDQCKACVIRHKGGPPRAWRMLKGRQTWKGRLPLDRGKARRVRHLKCSAHAVRFVSRAAWLSQVKIMWKQSEAALAELDLTERQDGGTPGSSGSMRTKEFLKGPRFCEQC